MPSPACLAGHTSSAPVTGYVSSAFGPEIWGARRLLGCSHRCAIAGPPLPTDQPGAGSAWPRLLHQRLRFGALRPIATGTEPGLRAAAVAAGARPASAGRAWSAVH